MDRNRGYKVTSQLFVKVSLSLSLCMISHIIITEKYVRAVFSHRPSSPPQSQNRRHQGHPRPHLPLSHLRLHHHHTTGRPHCHHCSDSRHHRYDRHCRDSRHHRYDRHHCLRLDCGGQFRLYQDGGQHGDGHDRSGWVLSVGQTLDCQ